MTAKEYFLENCGYELQTTAWDDLTIAEHFSMNAIKDTYLNLLKEFKNNYKYLTELVLILNHKIWQHYEKNDTIARLYNSLWEQLDKWCCENLKGEELQYFYRTLD